MCARLSVRCLRDSPQGGLTPPWSNRSWPGPCAGGRDAIVPTVIVVGLLAHGNPPTDSSDLGNVAELTIRVNAQTPPEPTPWLGFGANHNRLMDEHQDADWYVALNADAKLSAKQLHMLVEGAEAHSFDLVAPLLREPWGSNDKPNVSLPSPWQLFASTVLPGSLRAHRPTTGSRYEPMVDSAWVPGTCMVIRRSLMRELRFDERYFMYFEDVDLSRRARELGARVGVCTRVTVDHAVGWRTDDPLVVRRGVEYARSIRIFAESSGHSPLLMQIAALAHTSLRAAVPGRAPSARTAARAVASGLIAPTRPGLAELADAHNNLYGLRDGPGQTIA